MPLGMKTASSAATVLLRPDGGRSAADRAPPAPEPRLSYQLAASSASDRSSGPPETGSAGCAAPHTRQTSASRRMTAAHS